MKILCLQHVPFERPGYIQTWAQKQSHHLTVTRLFDEEILPDPDTIDGLIVLGGPMSVHDEKQYSWLQKEKQFIHECIAREKKVLGICLGAQLIADVLGAEVTPMIHKEMGWFSVNWTKTVQNLPMFNFLPAKQIVLHWHGEQFEIPEDSLHLAFSEACGNQAFLYQSHVLGLQFHMEMTKEGLEDLIANSKQELKWSGGPWIQQPEAMLNNGYFKNSHYKMNNLLENFFHT